MQSKSQQLTDADADLISLCTASHIAVWRGYCEPTQCSLTAKLREMEVEFCFFKKSAPAVNLKFKGAGHDIQ